MAQAFAIWGSVAVQYGFPLSGTRAVARERHDPQRLGEIVAGVLGAQALLAVALLIVAAALYVSVPAFYDMPILLGWATAQAVVSGLLPMWYFTGRERAFLMARIDSAAKLVSLVAILLLVRGPDDSWRVLAVYALVGGLSTPLAFALILGEIRLPRFRPRLALGTLREGAGLGLLGIISTSLGAGSALLLGALLTPRQVALFVAAEKLCQPIATVLNPLNAALMARLSHLVHASPDEARRMAGLGLVLVLAAAGVAAAGIAAGAPWLIPLVFGPGYEGAVPVLRVMALTIPLVVANIALSLQWFIPHGLDRWLALFVTTGAVVHVTLAFAVVPLYGARGMAWIVVTAQALVFVGLLLTLGRLGLLLGGGRLSNRLPRAATAARPGVLAPAPAASRPAAVSDGGGAPPPERGDGPSSAD